MNTHTIATPTTTAVTVELGADARITYDTEPGHPAIVEIAGAGPLRR